MRDKISKLLIIFVLGMGGGIFASQIVWPYLVEKQIFNQYGILPETQIIETRETIIQENTALVNAIPKVQNAVAGVKSTISGRAVEGSGFVLTTDGMMVTFADLVGTASTTQIHIDGKTYAFQVLKKDLKKNLILLKLDGSNFKTARLADPQKIKLGQRVFLLANIFTQGVPAMMANEGIVKSFDQDLIKTNITDKSALKGSSLFDIEGNFLGLNLVDSVGNITTVPVWQIKEYAGL